MSDPAVGGRIFFSNACRSLETEDEIRLTSVGVDIGSSTSHLAFSRLVLERLDNRYVVTAREVFHESEVLLTPYAGDATIDGAALTAFLARQYALAGLAPERIDTGALILTGVAVRRANARAIGELFAAQAGKFVAVSAGDALEATLAAHGSGAVARSIREDACVMNLDVGGGTSKLAVCERGQVVEVTALDIGARILAFDECGRATRIEPAARRFADEVGLTLESGAAPAVEGLALMVERMAERLLEAAAGTSLSPGTAALLRLEPLRNARPPDIVTFSGGVSEYIHARESQSFGDLGPALAHAIVRRIGSWGPRVVESDRGIRATVVGASQYTIQVSGSTIFIAPRDAVPIRNVPAVTPAMPLDSEVLNANAIAGATRTALQRLDLGDGARPVAICYRFRGSATFARLDAFCRGVIEGVAPVLAHGHPLVLVGDTDIGGLAGIHCHAELGLPQSVLSIDGIVLSELDFIDIGELLETSGAVPVVIKSLVFPASSAVGRETERR
jgi:ethanolamine utilization protein EutA